MMENQASLHVQDVFEPQLCIELALLLGNIIDLELLCCQSLYNIAALVHFPHVAQEFSKLYLSLCFLLWGTSYILCEEFRGGLSHRQDAGFVTALFFKLVACISERMPRGGGCRICLIDHNS